ncbi:ImmA/IrrE family metallo-endopeptidase [Clostridium sp.]|uniref:ImmA/IrrE family metallo-endopeptidase n=1 Tax=Clostridium sp. TaxID=1506 RepID=UPI003995548F
MDWTLEENISKLSLRIREILDVEDFIEDIDELVFKLGGQLEEVDFIENFADAKITKHDDTFTITVCRQPETRRRFTIAHELGHLFLHMGYGLDRELWNSNENSEFFRCQSNRLEYQAHAFAAAFLMPKELFREVMLKNYEDGSFYMDEVANYFGVSLEAAINRAKFLNMISW